jgi:hypothetical protein
LDEEFPDYQKLLDDMATDPTPFTLPGLPTLAATPSASGQKRSRAFPTEDEGEFEYTRASGSGIHHSVNASSSADPILPPPQGPMGQEDGDIPRELDRANLVKVFAASPLLPEPTLLKVDHVATLLALAVDGPVQKAAIKFLAPAYSQQEAEAIWTAWAPHLAPPPDHPMAGGTLLRDTILQALCTPYPTTKQAKEVAGKLVNDLAQAVATQTFVAHTAADISDEEMEVNIHPSHFVQAWAYVPLSSHSLNETCPFTGLNPPRGTPTEDSGRRRKIHTSTEEQTHSMVPFVGLAQQLLARIATLAHAIWLAIPALFSHIGTFSPLI